MMNLNQWKCPRHGYYSRGISAACPVCEQSIASRAPQEPLTPAPASPSCPYCNGDLEPDTEWTPVQHSNGSNLQYYFNCATCRSRTPPGPSRDIAVALAKHHQKKQAEDRAAETLYRAMDEREALRRALAEIHAISGRRFASMEDVNHIAYAAITAQKGDKTK